MRIPDGLEPLVDYGILDEVIRPLMSGKEAQIYLVRSKDKLCVAKVYKETQQRTFKNRAAYTEGRKVRNSRDQRAIGKRSKHGRAEEEAVWRSTEVDVIHRLHAGGVRVPVPYHFVEGVLLMELVADAEGHPAPRLGEMQFEPEEARAIYDRLIREVVRMLCAGVVHGDLSGFNVLVGGDGPVIIDFPQSVDTAHNANARKLLLRDVENLHTFLLRFVPGARRMPYAEEMWDLYQKNLLTPETPLSGRFRGARAAVNVSDVIGLIQEADEDERTRRKGLGLRGGPHESARVIAATQRSDRTQDTQRINRPQDKQQGDQPQERPRGDRPRLRGQGDRPQDRQQGDQPQERPRGDRPRLRGQGDRPQDRQQGDRPQDRQQGDRPQDRRQGDRPQDGRQADRPQDRQQGNRPQDRQQGDRPQDRQPGNRPQDRQPGNRPQDRQQGTRPQDRQQGDRPQESPRQPRPQPQSDSRSDSPRSAPRQRPNRSTPNRPTQPNPGIDAPPPRSTSDKRGQRRSGPEVIVMYRRRRSSPS